MKRHTWYWESKELSDTVRVNEVLKFLKGQEVDVIYIQYSSNTTATDYRNFIKKASSLGIEVHALLGSPSWYYEIAEVMTRLERIKNYNAGSNPEEMFVGIHFDIEPHTLPEWKDPETQPTVIATWLDTMKQYHSYIKLNLNLQISVSVPLASKSIVFEDKPLYEHFLKYHDKIVVMSYRDFAEGSDSITYHAEKLFEVATSCKRAGSAIYGVEIGPNVEANKVTFGEEGKLVMEEEIRKADFYFKSNYNLAFGGHAIHSVKHWMLATK